ncbi:hypothetical protein JR338_09045 [Chloroflexota bacterium]|nr:hypothetical protein JR338_09045 [Chloroflexota bacterium]
MGRVVCYAGANYPEAPRRVIWHEMIYEVTEIIDRQRHPDSLLFLVRCSPGETLFELIYILESETWQIHFKEDLSL